MKTQMTDNSNQYLFGYDPMIIKRLTSRTIDSHMNFLKVYLKPGMKVLDCGCGPGSISIGIARLVYPGEVIAIDIEHEQINIAREAAVSAGVTNIDFQQADIFALPFNDSTFDLVCSHAVLTHLKNPLDAVLEQKRVAKNGGYVATRDPYINGKEIYPADELLREGLDLYFQPIIESGGDKELGIKLGKLFHDAGFCDIQHNLIIEKFDIAVMAKFFPQVFLNSTYYKQQIAAGKLSREKLNACAEAWSNFVNFPGGFHGGQWGEVIGCKS